MRNSRLKRIFVDRTIELEENDGKETIARAKNVFSFKGFLWLTGGIHGAVERGPCKPTGKTPIAVHRMIEDGTYAQLFGGFGEDLERLCWTESQIVALCRDHRALLRKDGYPTFFLFEGENGGFFVEKVYVTAFSGRLDTYRDPFECRTIWRPGGLPHIVVPDLSQ